MKVMTTYRLNPFTLLLTLSLAGCSVGPDYQAPKPQLPGSYHALDSQERSKPQTSAVDTRWWRNFNDPQLDSLIARAIAGNLSLQQTVLRIAGAREQLSQAQGGLFPSLNGSAKVTRQQLGLEGLLKANGVNDQVDSTVASQLNGLTQPVTLYQGSFDASWELDLWGKVRRQIESANAQQQAAIEQRNDALVSLEAEVVRAWLQLRGAQATVNTLQQQIAVADQTWQLTQSQQRNGLAPLTDVENARAQLSSLQAQLPQYQAQTRQAMNGLAVLIGKTPGALDAELQTPKALPALPNAVAVGIPSTLARRRPDIRQAEAKLHAQTAGIGVSVAQLFPSLSLTGQLGVRNTDASYLDDWSSHFYSVGPSLSIPLFQGGRLVSSVKLARAQQASAALDYRQTVLTALQDVENALVSYRADQQRVTALDETTGALQRTFDLASDSYRQGLSTFLEVLDAQRQLAQAEEQATQARMQSGLDLVALYKALGGGWETYQNVQLPQYDVFGPATQVN
ncbi:NodT family efflux transporter outer membrane factor (OMF) lipoprotein [Pantoea sp. PNA 14-12]|uniref:efflux transporter outer membrane subunit n=1 Tax=Pantoea TaxID=53335 RepID=UPI00073725A5|nr:MULTISPECIES: efflux transporter outer membrane subunit [Pantoea]KTS29955.1 RND transporter [Pantoea stewartii]MBC0854222.1 efflux transporter outer membrane subunit [Pantoea stewartii]MCU7368640.1 efflux transporter outer membrane subunit [Pantoea stewartii]MDF7784372.1 efflux transporter outer membrane subunit [Pantoea stewartii]MDK2631824.1 efflux transporter outer membrane subunit [Pantoea stewartii subsp. indologenes]